MLFNNCSEAMSEVIRRTPVGKIISNIPIPASQRTGSKGFQFPLTGGTRDVLYKMNIGDFIKVKAEHAHRYGVGSSSYGDGWSTVRRTLPNGSIVIWKKEKKGYLGSQLREYDKQSRLDAYREHVKEQLANL